MLPALCGGDSRKFSARNSSFQMRAEVPLAMKPATDLPESSPAPSAGPEQCPACGSAAVLYRIRLEDQPEVEAHVRRLWLACMDCNHRWPAETD